MSVINRLFLKKKLIQQGVYNHTKNLVSVAKIEQHTLNRYKT